MKFSIDDLGARVNAHRANLSIRTAAEEIGIGHATLSRIERGHVPDLETFLKLCNWIGEDPSNVLGMQASSTKSSIADVHMRKKGTQEKETAAALGDLIFHARRAVIALDQV